MQHQFLSPNGGLTLLPLPGFESLAERVRDGVEERGRKSAADLQQPEDNTTPVDIVVPQFGLRSSGEPYLQLGKQHIGGHDCIILGSGPGTYSMLGQLNLLLCYLVGRRARRISVVLGYFPLSRSDKDEGGLEFALVTHITRQMLAASENRLDRIITVDLHAPQVAMSGGRTGLITEVSLARRLLDQAIRAALETKQRVCLCFPDDTALKRLEDAVEQTETRYGETFAKVHGSKRRKNSEELYRLELFGDVQAVNNSLVINIDDEIGTGKTNILSAESLRRDFRAKEAWGAVTHAVFANNAALKFANPECPVSRLFISDTIPIEDRHDVLSLVSDKKITVIPWFKDLAWMVYHHHWDMSIREMR